jgi:DNA-binding NarL/FixJ family response regulator
VRRGVERRDAIELAAETRPDFLIMDISMPGLSGIDATVEIRKILPQIEVLILTMHESDRMAGQALRAGARGYMIKNESEDRLMEALEALSRGQLYFSPSVSETLLQDFLHSKPSHDLEQLTPRERQVVKLVAEGKSNKVIASTLNLSIKTIETHRATAMLKIGARSAADLTLYPRATPRSALANTRRVRGKRPPQLPRGPGQAAQSRQLVEPSPVADVGADER